MTYMKTDPEMMNNLSKTRFKEIYPLIAGQIIEKCGITEGIGIDIGSGPGALAIALVKLTELNMYSLDISYNAHKIAIENIENTGLSDKVFPIVADVHQLPFEDNFADLMVSRGSMFFWKDKEDCFREIYRVLKPTGFAYIGGGYGSAELKDKIKKSRKNDSNRTHDKIPKIDVTQLKNDLNNANIKDFDIINDSSGLWVLIKN